MRLFDRMIYRLITLARNKNTVQLLHRFANVDNHNLIFSNIYLGNIISAQNISFLTEKNIGAIVNCTENESFHEYFIDKPTFRLAIQDHKEIQNIEKMKIEIMEAIDFMDKCYNENKIIYVHCYFGILRSATVVAAFLIRKYNMSMEDAIHIVQEQRPYALSSIYNFNEVLKHVEQHSR